MMLDCFTLSCTSCIKGRIYVTENKCVQYVSLVVARNGLRYVVRWWLCVWWLVALQNSKLDNMWRKQKIWEKRREERMSCSVSVGIYVRWLRDGMWYHHFQGTPHRKVVKKIPGRLQVQKVFICLFFFFFRKKCSDRAEKFVCTLHLLTHHHFYKSKSVKIGSNFLWVFRRTRVLGLICLETKMKICNTFICLGQ